MKHYVNPCKVITGANTRWSYANVWERRLIFYFPLKRIKALYGKIE